MKNSLFAAGLAVLLCAAAPCMAGEKSVSELRKRLRDTSIRASR